MTVNGFEDILTVDGNIKRAKDIKNIDICDFWMWKYFQTNHMPLWNMKAYFLKIKLEVILSLNQILFAHWYLSY